MTRCPFGKNSSLIFWGWCQWHFSAPCSFRGSFSHNHLDQFPSQPSNEWFISFPSQSIRTTVREHSSLHSPMELTEEWVESAFHSPTSSVHFHSTSFYRTISVFQEHFLHTEQHLRGCSLGNPTMAWHYFRNEENKCIERLNDLLSVQFVDPLSGPESLLLVISWVPHGLGKVVHLCFRFSIWKMKA
jgi:hypothetical protein